MATEPQSVDAVEPGGKPRWTLQLFAEGLRGERQEGDAASFHIVRDHLPESIQLLDGLLVKRTLVVKKPRKTTLQLEPGPFRTLSRWIGQPTLLRLALKQRLSWTLPIGVLFVLGSLPLPGDPEAGLDPTPFHPVWAILGALLIVQGFVARRWPRPVLFLLDSLWFVGLAAATAYGVWQGDSPYWLVVVLLQLGLAVGGVRLWQRFRHA